MYQPFSSVSMSMLVTPIYLISDYLKMQILTFNRNIFTIKVGGLFRN